VTQTSSFVLPFGKAHNDAAWKSGPKAANLSLFHSLGFPVPNGFVITINALEQVLSTSGLASPVSAILAEIDELSGSDVAQQPAALRALVAQATIPQELIDEVGAAYLAMGGKAVSVRSSSTLEDRLNATFAGQHDTVLNVLDDAQLWDAIKECWESLWSDRAIRYLRAMDMSAREMKMALVVQEMVQADTSGVAFTIHPVTSDGTQAVVYAGYGLGEGTVSGEVSPDEAVIARESMEIAEITLGAKATKVTASADGGTAQVELASAQREAMAITEAQVIEVATMALATERQMHGVPQDVEWAMSGGKLFLLQARPMSRPAAVDAGVTWEPPLPGTHWRRNWRLGEWLSAPVTPLFSTWMLPVLVASREETGTGELGWEIKAHFAMPQPWSCIVNGYFYTRQDHPIRAPGGPPDINRRLMMARENNEEMGRWETEWLPAYLKRFEEHLRVDYATASSDELLALVGTLSREAGEFWSLMSIAGYGFQELMFKPIYEHVVPEKGRPSYQDLFAGFRTLIIEGQECLHALALRVRDDAAMAERFATSTPGAIVASLATLPGWLQEGLAELRETYGHELYSLDFYFPTAGETPEVTIAMIQGYLRSDTRSPFELTRAAGRRRTRGVRHVRASLADRPQEQADIDELIDSFQRSAIAREDEAFYFQRPWPLIRRTVLELGRRLTEAGALDHAESVFFLELDELSGVVAGLAQGDSVISLEGVAAGRKQTWEHHGRLAPPDHIPDDGVFDRAMDRDAGYYDDEHGRRVVGQSASPGRATGRARVIRSPEDAIRFVKGDVLITTAASPALTPLLLLAVGLVTEAGGGASHSSLVARELGVPAVVNTGIATQVIQDGQLVEVDGTRGVVRLL
jgi:phosphohistidine swiveling domain-containing protein